MNVPNFHKFPHVHAASSITYNGNNYAFNYDANGNLTSGPDLSNIDQVVTRTVAYDADNMPTQIVRGTTTVNFTYDGTGTRIKKEVSGGSTTLYIGAHYEVKDSVITKYIFGGNLRLAVLKGSLTYYYHKDHLGSTGAITDDTGAKVESAEYHPFGTTREHTGTDVSAYKFTDQELDNETGLYNYNARLYDPVIGMFVTPDSIVPNMFDPQMLNRYAYCRNNPLIYVDPSGHTLRDPNTGDNGGHADDYGNSVGQKAAAGNEPARITKKGIPGLFERLNLFNLNCAYGKGNVTQNMLDNYYDAIAFADAIRDITGKKPSSFFDGSNFSISFDRGNVKISMEVINGLAQNEGDITDVIGGGLDVINGITNIKYGYLVNVMKGYYASTTCYGAKGVLTVAYQGGSEMGELVCPITRIEFSFNQDMLLAGNRRDWTILYYEIIGTRECSPRCVFIGKIRSNE